ncbi:cohesin complex subunit SCC1 [Vigna unguiculata]|uniref:Cohesin complex subunit SCC1 n=2 Tax=Vigna unguiculata TaxID=3917 RepID=A0A4D6MIK7_VIGUN|nr:cohesin complex subunit SCC1 [Vigna unguiculata]
MAATMHAKINRRKLDKLNIIKICEEILNPSVPMALRLSGILMGGVVIVYERKVKLLYDDVTRFLVEINEAWKVKTAPDPTLLPKAKSKAKKEAVTLPGIRETNVADIEQSLQFSNTGTTTGFQHNAYFTMRLDSVDEPFISNGAREDQDPSEFLHQADVENITLFERFETFQANADPYNRFERFDIEGDEETLVNVTSGDQIPTALIPSPPHQDEPTRADMFEDLHPEQQDIRQPDEAMPPRQEPRRRGPNKRKRGQRLHIEMDYEQTIIPVHIYQHWLQNASDIVSRRGRKKQQTNVLSSTKIANLMKLPPVALSGDLFTAENNDIYYPAPILDLWIKSIQPPHDSPSERISAHHPPEPSFSSPPGVHSGDFMQFPSEDFDSRLDNQAPPVEKQRKNVLMDELTASLLRGHDSTPHVSSVKAGDSAHSFPRPASEHGPASLSDFDSGRFKNKRYSSSANSSGGLEPLVEDVNFKLARLYEDGPTPDQELLVETGPTQTQVNINHPSDKITDSIQAQMKAHFDTPGAPPVESLHNLAAGMTRTSAAQLFYQICVLASRDALKVEQKVPYGEILFSRGLKM